MIILVWVAVSLPLGIIVGRIIRMPARDGSEADPEFGMASGSNLMPPQ